MQEGHSDHGKKQGAGTIVNVASMASTAAGRGGLAYTSAKHGLLGLTRQMSLDHGRTGVRINAVLPGPIATEMIARVLAIPQHPVTMKMGMSPAKRLENRLKLLRRSHSSHLMMQALFMAQHWL